MEEEMILHPIRKFLILIFYKRVKIEGTNRYERKPTKIAKPFFDCVYCMPSVYGTLIYIYLNIGENWTPAYFIDLMITLVCSSILSGLIYSKI